jgi:hypothetical protein
LGDRVWSRSELVSDCGFVGGGRWEWCVSGDRRWWFACEFLAFVFELFTLKFEFFFLPFV